jgi:hypothetical protein
MVLLLVEVFGGLISDIKKKVLQIMKEKVNVHCNIVIYSNINLEKGLKYSLCLEKLLSYFHISVILSSIERKQCI